MINLKTPAGPYTLHLPYDITVTVQPLTTAGMAMAQAEARRQVDRQLADVRAQTDNGLARGDRPDPHDEATREGLYQDALIRAIGVRHITAWEGVADAEDKAAPVTPENVTAVLSLFPVGERFYQEFTLQQVLLTAAKKGSGLSAAGTSSPAEGPTTVAAAVNRASSAPPGGEA